jgi:hypothetical protein
MSIFYEIEFAKYILPYPRSKAAALYRLALAVNLGFLEAVAPLRAALAYMDMR